jgi:hypothetical protein
MIGFLVIGISYCSCCWHNVLHVKFMVLCSAKVPIVKVFQDFTSPWFGFSYLSMDFDVDYDIDYKTLHGEGVSLTS